MSTGVLREKEQLPQAVVEASPTVPISLPVVEGGGGAREALHHVASGTSALAAAMFFERGMGFAANVLAARLAGVGVFGAYSLGISTANNISTYAAGGIGATAARFSGKYPHGTPGYGTLARALMIVSLVSAVLASVVLWFGAVPIAAVMHKPQLASLLRWAIASAASMILLECARGFFVGQRRLKAVLCVSALTGMGMLGFLPLAAHMRNAPHMLLLQGVVTLGAVSVCLLLHRKLRLDAPLRTTGDPISLKGVLTEVWTFGLVQLVGLVGSNAAGWWMVMLVGRADTSLAQIGFFAVASQLRNMAGIAPGLLAEGSYAAMATPDSDGDRTPHRVMALCSFAALSVSLFVATTGIVLAPWLLGMLYGGTYKPASVAVAVGLALAVVHMGNAPAAARLTIVSIRASAVINTTWAVCVAISATVFLSGNGAAWKAMAIYLCAHVVSSVLVLISLAKMDHVPAGMVTTFAIAAVAGVSLAGLAILRDSLHVAGTGCTIAMLAVALTATVALYAAGARYRLLPSRSQLSRLVHGVVGRIRGGRSYV